MQLTCYLHLCLGFALLGSSAASWNCCAVACCYCPGRLLGRAPELHCGTCALLAGWVVGAIGGVWERGPIKWVDPTPRHAINLLFTPVFGICLVGELCCILELLCCGMLLLSWKATRKGA